MRLKLLAMIAATVTLAAPAQAVVVFVLSETPSGGFESLAVHESFEGAPVKDSPLASFVSAGITYAPVTGCGDATACPGNVWVSSPGYSNYGIPGNTTSSILTATGNEYFTVTPGFTVRSLGFDIYTINEPLNPKSVGGAAPVLVSVLTSGGLTSLNLPAPIGNFGFLGIVSDDPILSLTWQANLGGVRNTGIDDIRVSEHAVPEPGTLILIGSGLATMALKRRRKSPIA
jgi:hypothetical protein